MPYSRYPHDLANSLCSILLARAHSVHLRVLDGSSYGPEQQELALESLLEFTREPALMTDVYINYDCDVQCTNLFETICHSLSSHALPRDGMVSWFLCPMGRFRTLERGVGTLQDVQFFYEVHGLERFGNIGGCS